MRPKVPQRRIKVWFRIFLTMVGLFIATIVVCAVVFFVSSWKKTGSILSPIFQSVQQLTPGTATFLVKDMCQSENLACANVAMSDATTVRITMDSGGVVYLSTQKDLKKQLASLQQVISQLTIKGKQFKSLDFRFDHIIVSF